MATIQTAAGRLLQSRKPADVGMWSNGPFSSGLLPPMWSDGERWGPDGIGGFLASYEQIFRTQPVLAGAVNKLSRRAASLPFDGYMAGDNGAREVVKGDSLDSLLHHPVPGWSGLQLLQGIFQSLLINGNAVVAKVRPIPDEPPQMLWLLDWTRLNAWAPVGGRIEWWSTNQFGVESWIDAKDVMHFAWASPAGFQVGVSPLEQLGTTLRIEDAAQRHQIASFKNGNRPSLMITLGDAVKPTKDVLDHNRGAIEALHKGPDNSGKTLFLAGGAKAAPLSLSPVEAALIEQRKLNREDVGMVYDLAGPLMNDLTHGTYSNIEELNRGLYRDVLPPWLELVTQTFQTQLLDPEPSWLDRSVAFDLTDKLRGDPVQQAQSLRLQVESGIITRNEARRILGMPPVGDPSDPNAPANQLTANVNNQGPVGAGKDLTAPIPATEPPTAEPAQQ